MVINISCKLEKASYNIFFVIAVMVKSLYTLQLSSVQNSLNAIVFKLQVSLLMMEVTEKPKSSYYSVSY